MITSRPVPSSPFNAAASGSHNAARLPAWVWERTPGSSDADESGIGIGSSARASASSPSRCAQARSINPAVCAVVPRKKPASIAEPPVGSASTSNTGRGQVNAKPNADVVTPGDPAAEASTISAIRSALPRIQAPRRPCRWRHGQPAPPPGRRAPER